MTTFALSTDDLIDRIYALSALHNILHAPAAIPPALNRDHAPALRQALDYAFARICAMLAPATADCSTTTDTLTVNLSVELGSSAPAGMRQSAVRRLLEQAVVSELLASVYLNYDATLAATYSDAAASTLASLRQSLISQPTGSVAIRPYT